MEDGHQSRDVELIELSSEIVAAYVGHTPVRLYVMGEAASAVAVSSGCRRSRPETSAPKGALSCRISTISPPFRTPR